MNKNLILFLAGIIVLYLLVVLMIRFSGMRRRNGINVTLSEEAQAKERTALEAQKAAVAANNALRLFIVQITRFASKHGLALLMPANVVWKNDSCRLTLLLAGKGGVLGVKSIRFGGEVQGNVSAPMWIRRENGEESEFKNPLLGCEADKATLQALLAENGFADVPVDCVTVFINPKVQINAPAAVRRFTEQELFEALESGALCPDAGCDAEAIAKVLQAHIPAAQ